MSSNNTSTLNRIKDFCTHAFAVSPPESAITEDDETLAEKVAVFIVGRKLTAPAIMLLETGRPFNYIGSQLLTFLSPFISIIFTTAKEFNQFTLFLEKRESIPCIIRHIETLEDKCNG
ncbi:MAG: hypothetical protein QGG64_08940 [Candidatus Latescibacteria bacterium]|nr:hypothetical protein [Candidatus Latescibacterota bacterium]